MRVHPFGIGGLPLGCRCNPGVNTLNTAGALLLRCLISLALYTLWPQPSAQASDLILA
jgi:hypothetical protein